MTSLLSAGLVTSAQAELGDLVAEFEFAAEQFALNPVRAEIYASLPQANSVAVISTDSLELQAMPFIGSSPKGLAVSADGLRLFVANSGSASLGVLDTETLSFLPSIPLPTNPSDVVAGRDSLFVTPATSATGIMQIDSATGSYMGDFSNGVLIYSNGMLAISPDKNALYFGNRGLSPGTLAKFDVSTDTPALLLKNAHGSLGSNGQDVALSHDGTFASYAVGGGNGPGYGIYKLSVGDFTPLGEFVTGAYPREIAFSHDDQTAFTVNQSGEIKVFDTNTLLPVGSIATPGEARELIVDNSGRYLFAAFDDALRVYHTGHGNVTPANEPPVANAGADLLVETGLPVTLDGSGSFDPDGNHPLVFDWSITQQPLGSLAMLSDSGLPTPSFVPDLPGDYAIELVVTDNQGASSEPGAVTISAYPQVTVGGSASALTLTKVVCINESSGMRIKLYNIAPQSAWDCEAAGLAVNQGDRIRMNIFGDAQ